MTVEASKTGSPSFRHRVQSRIAAWRLTIDREIEGDGSILAFGQRGNQPVVLKVVRHHGDEWRSGDMLEAFDGHGVVRVLDRFDGAVLMERLRPGTSLVSIAVEDDDRATGILADVIGRMSPRAPVSTTPTVQEWQRALERYAASADEHVPRPLLEEAQQVYSDLAASQSRPRLLHGDLHHDNVLLDLDRGWLAIDPKGVVGEPEYEIGAALRNPYDRPELFADPATIRRRVDRFARQLHLDASRILAWAFAQAVLAVVWVVEDEGVVRPDHPWITLANSIHPMLRG